MPFQNLVMILPHYSTSKDHNKVYGQKSNKLRLCFVAMSMMNRCATFHGDSPSGEKVKFYLASAINIELPETVVLCTTLYRNPMQVSKFGGAFDQLFTEDASLLLLYCCAKKLKMTKSSNQGGPALIFPRVGICILTSERREGQWNELRTPLERGGIALGRGDQLAVKPAFGWSESAAVLPLRSVLVWPILFEPEGPCGPEGVLTVTTWHIHLYASFLKKGLSSCQMHTAKFLQNSVKTVRSDTFSKSASQTLRAYLPGKEKPVREAPNY